MARATLILVRIALPILTVMETEPWKYGHTIPRWRLRKRWFPGDIAAPLTATWRSTLAATRAGARLHIGATISDGGRRRPALARGIIWPTPTMARLPRRFISTARSRTR